MPKMYFTGYNNCSLQKQTKEYNLLKRGVRKRFFSMCDFCIHKWKRKVNIMKHRIKLRPDEVKDFVAAATRCSFDVDISYNSFIVDAKSIIGVLGLNFNQILTVSYGGYDADFEKYLQKFSVAC